MGDGDNKVQLGCGTLIVIAIIVAMFSGGRGTSGLRSEIGQLNHKIDRLETKIDALSQKLDAKPTAESGRGEVKFR